MAVAVVFLPLIAAVIAGFFGRVIGDRGAQLVTCGALLLSAVLGLFLFRDILAAEEVRVIPLASWIVAGGVDVSWSLRLDTLSGVMIGVVTVVSAMVHVYSIGYMAEDPSIPRFMAYISLFTFFMLALVTADNFVQLFFGWEGVGLMSYLLVGFWYDRPSANAAAIKAFLVNRVGDFGFSLGIYAVFVIFGSLDFGTVFGAAPKVVGKTMEFLGWQLDSLTLACILLFIGAMGKSAQIPLHTWLPDAMEGPTPVSALIHAATMVTAGVFMVARLSPLFEYAPTALAVVGIIGGTTAIFAASIGMVQPDIKKVVAYSTCSQLGYMFVAAGVSAYGAADGRRTGHAPDGWPMAEDPDHLCHDVDRRSLANRHTLLLGILLEGHDPRRGLGVGDGGWSLFLGARYRRGVHDRLLYLACDVHDLSRRAACRRGGDASCA